MTNMKPSQFILISFFVFLFAAVLVLYIDSFKAYNDNQAKLTEYKNIFPPKELKPFSTIVAGAHSNIKIIQDSIYSLSIGFTMKDIPPKLSEYKIVNDTLFILESDIQAQTQTVIRCRSIHSIIGKSNSDISFKNFKTDSLYIHLEESSLQGTLNKLGINALELHINNGSRLHLSLNQSKIGVGILKSNNSDINLTGENTFHLLNIELENNSVLSLSGIRDKLYIKSDTSSRYNIRNH